MGKGPTWRAAGKKENQSPSQNHRRERHDMHDFSKSSSLLFCTLDVLSSLPGFHTLHDCLRASTRPAP